jgi:predicted phosphodiesterase
MHRLLIRLPTVLLPIAVGVLGAWLGMAAWGRTTVSMGPFRVQLAAGFGRGVTEIGLPPFGHLTADTHLAPLRLTATLVDIRLPQLAEDVANEGIDGISRRVQHDANSRLAPFFLHLVGAALAGTVVLAFLVFRTRWPQIVAALLATFLAVGGSELLALRTYDSSALLTPTYSGALSLAPQLIGPAQTALDRIDKFRAELTRVVDGAARVYGSIQSGPLTPGNEIRVLHISDIHLSPLGLAFAREVANAFDVDLVIDTGDLTSFGTPAEALIASSIPGLGRPYVFVRGNHDSISLQAEVAGEPNAIVLDGQTQEIEGLRIYGLGDPLFTPDKRAALDGDQIAARVRTAEPRVLQDVEALPEPPDVVAVHDDRMAEVLAGRVPLVISGHFHVPSARADHGTVFLRVGSTGGAGATVFTQEGGVPLSAEILYFTRSDAPRLIGYDLIEQSPQSGSLTVKRYLIEEEFGTLVPSPPATVTPAPLTPSPSV